MFSTITASEFHKKYQTENLTIIDVRAKEDFDARHISGAVNIPIEELGNKINTLDPNTNYYMMCYSGNRSAMASEILASERFKATNILGGMNEWAGDTTN